MVRFRRGESMKNQRVYVAASYSQVGNSTGRNVALSIANDTCEDDVIKTAPMLMYDTYERDGETYPRYTVGYSKKQWETIEQMANKEGDELVVVGDLMPTKDHKGLMLNTNTLQTPDEPFDKERHRARTVAKRLENEQAARLREQSALASDAEEASPLDSSLELA